MYLFASILNEMLASYVSLNSFTQLTVTGTGTRVVYKWEPKSGNLYVDLKDQRSRRPGRTRGATFAFFRLIYLLERLYGRRRPIGQLGPPSEERIRLRPDPGLVFHSSDVSEARRTSTPDDVERARVTTTFMGLYGSTSPLPPHFMEQIALSDYQGGPQPIREFFDVFHHRLLSLVYRSLVEVPLRGDVPQERRRSLHAAHVLHGRRRRLPRLSDALDRVSSTCATRRCSPRSRARPAASRWCCAICSARWACASSSSSGTGR
jgi:hypothetical protein